MERKEVKKWPFWREKSVFFQNSEKGAKIGLFKGSFVEQYFRGRV